MVGIFNQPPEVMLIQEASWIGDCKALFKRKNDVYKAEATFVDCKADAVLFFLYRKKTLSGSTSVFACEHPYTCMCEHATQKATVPHSTLFQEREAQGMTPAKRQAEMISLANSDFATQEESDDEYQWHRNDSGPRSPDTQYVSYNQPPHSLQLTVPKLGWMQSLVPSGPDKPS